MSIGHICFNVGLGLLYMLGVGLWMLIGLSVWHESVYMWIWRPWFRWPFITYLILTVGIALMIAGSWLP